MDHLGLSMGSIFRPRHFESSRSFSKDDDFFKFPEECGWNEDTGRFDSEPETPPNAFFQQWLFFGLLQTVLEGVNVQTNQFVQAHYINTEDLGKLLLEWERNTKPGDRKMTMRMIRAQLALDKARKIVSKFCCFNWDEWKTTKARATPSLEVDNDLALSLLVLGETLTNAKCRIVERVGFTIHGWHGDANEGWGVPSRVVLAMNTKGWCKRTIYVLSCQLQSHATALLAAMKVYEEIESTPTQFHVLQGHEGCSTEICLFKSTEDDKITYKPRHTAECKKPSSCAMLGPDPKQVKDVISDGHTPLLEYVAEHNHIPACVNVKSYGTSDSYGAISHVWADGRGNQENMQLFECQLKYIAKLIANCRWNDTPRKTALFWIDTLAIPRDGPARTEAVDRIDEAYRNAKFTIVLDLGLYSVMPGIQYHEMALRILASGWMRRLWTLQEAYLSRRILFAFRNEDLVEVDDIEERYFNSKHSLTSNLPTSARAYFHHIMGPARMSRIHDTTSEKTHDVIASVWRSAQWRTIQRKTDEPIVLRALFEISHKRTKTSATRGSIENLLNEATTSRPIMDNPRDPTNEDEKKVARMMSDIWTQLDEWSRGCIPSGVIFLPGARLPLPGFGWAPSSWMSGKEVDYPDPLALPQSKTTLMLGKGLSVRYPGFILHCQNSATVCWPKGDLVKFPCDSTLLEWYEMERANSEEETPTGMMLDNMNFAIILCRPKPRERQEIALLVQITDTVLQSSNGTSMPPRMYKVRIICRIWIRRETKIDRPSRWQEFREQTREDGNDDQDFIIGEELTNDQEWLVDGFTEEARPLVTAAERLPPTPTVRERRSIPITTREMPALTRARRSPRGHQANGRATNPGPRGALPAGALGGIPRRAQTLDFASETSLQQGLPNGGISRRATGFVRSRGNDTQQRWRQ